MGNAGIDATAEIIWVQLVGQLDHPTEGKHTVAECVVSYSPRTPVGHQGKRLLAERRSAAISVMGARVEVIGSQPSERHGDHGVHASSGAEGKLRPERFANKRVGESPTIEPDLDQQTCCRCAVHCRQQGEFVGRSYCGQDIEIYFRPEDGGGAEQLVRRWPEKANAAVNDVANTRRQVVICRRTGGNEFAQEERVTVGSGVELVGEQVVAPASIQHIGHIIAAEACQLHAADRLIVATVSEQLREPMIGDEIGVAIGADDHDRL